ncbi:MULTISPECIES: L-lactate dehydrogenase [Anaerococcus]|jgi:L-lactate dehydrogenase|uniref:L-lactate dehydrogenase n=1 Tax=Anaerococcus octavius TaxID=54007 RepID=A0A2I1M9K1_9FIRM|nr:MULTISPECIES: L-lactate dehydrogenase [Anaerococcus]MBS6106681.1 L-lactate dehydrogenase [Anaerococcus sp.]MDU2598251.1 L-lactate dehydrogenase [Anaerococcus sp.]MDU3177163.1 L-lactate dehydrogenase [Anaerococcus sp.]MDU4025569.1 L-lactate dehydrogenase [Anaerococcus sp.]MDU5229666.1 L-lactate dehydrogenase [Anaerococcus sp.]
MKDSKVILIGDGAVGSSFAYSSSLLGVGRELGIIDINEERVEGDVLDLTDALSFTYPKKVYKAEYADCKDAEVVVITAGIPQKPGETRLQLVDKNLVIFKDMIGKVVASGFDGIFVVASNPVDVTTYATMKYSGFPANKVIGSGTTLDTSRFKKQIGDLLDVDYRSVHAYIMGEHGDTEFPVWSNANVGGLSIEEWKSTHPNISQESLDAAFDKTVNAAYEIINKKGATFYGIGTALSSIVRAILNDENTVFLTSSYLNGEFGLKDIHIGVPTVIGKSGVAHIIEVPLSDKEQEQLEHSARTLREIIDNSNL